MKLTFLYNEGRLKRISKVASGNSPKDFFLGALDISDQGYDVEILEILDGASRGIFHIFNILLRLELWPNRATGGVLSSLSAEIRHLNKSDFIICTTTGIALAAGFFKALGFLKPNIVGIHCGLVNYRHGLIRKFVISLLLKQMMTLLYGVGELSPMRKTFCIPSRSIRVGQFGVDTEFWRFNPQNDGDYIGVVGNDGRRDFDLIVNAAQKSRHEFKVITQTPIHRKVPANLDVIKGSWHHEILSDTDIREFYYRSKIIVVPLKDFLQPSGQSVTLQAMACGRPVILTKTRGLWSPKLIRDFENVLMIDEGDTDDLIRKIDLLKKRNDLYETLRLNARRLIDGHFTTRHFANQLMELMPGLITK